MNAVPTVAAFGDTRTFDGSPLSIRIVAPPWLAELRSARTLVVCSPAPTVTGNPKTSGNVELCSIVMKGFVRVTLKFAGGVVPGAEAPMAVVPAVFGRKRMLAVWIAPGLIGAVMLAP